MVLATLALLVAACLPLARVFIGLDVFRPLLAAVLLSFGVSWGCRRAGAGPILTLLASTLAWFAFCALAFLGDTLAAGVAPTRSTFGALADLWSLGLELIRVRPSPAFAEAGLVLIAVTGVWAIVHSVEGLVFRLESPIKAVGMALVLWVVPLAVAQPTPRAWAWAVPFLAAAAALILAFAGSDLGRWGRWVHDPQGAPRRGLAVPGGAVAGIAIVAGVLLAGTLPGFGDPPWYELRGIGGSRLTSNPIVEIRGRLVDQDDRPLLRVSTPRPVYLRVTGLDVYGAREEWTLDGIEAAPASGRLPGERRPTDQPLEVDVTVAGLSPETLLVPAPYQPVAVGGPAADAFQYDPDTATLTLDQGVEITSGDRYQVRSAIPQPTAEALLAAGEHFPATDPLVALPPTVPQSVRDLATRIVTEAGATTPFEQALAIQNVMRTWEYSLDPQPGHGATAMESFITNQAGYCEQFAGTMAVMLRSLGVPTRVAVGFTPGTPVGDGTYVIAGANAHAWVEVLFPGQGWIAFEPTPRADGNVLVPSATNLAPAQTELQAQGEAVPPVDPADNPDLNPQPDEGAEANDFPTRAPGTALPGAAEQGGQSGRGWLVAALVAVVLVAGVVLVNRSRRAGIAKLPVRERVLLARRRIGVLGHGLGQAALPAETDREYLQRLAPRQWAAGELADLVEQVRWAPARPGPAAGAPAVAAERADHAADSLSAHLLGGLSGPRRSLVRLRGWAGVTAQALRQRSSRSRSVRLRSSRYRWRPSRS